MLFSFWLAITLSVGTVRANIPRVIDLANAPYDAQIQGTLEGSSSIGRTLHARDASEGDYVCGYMQGNLRTTK